MPSLSPAAGRRERELDKGNEVDYFSKLKSPSPSRSSHGGRQPRALIRAFSFATAWIRGRAASHRRAPIALAVRTRPRCWKDGGGGSGGGGRRTAAQRPGPPERQAPPPIALGLGRGAGAGRVATNAEVREAESGLGPTCWPPPGPRPPGALQNSTLARAGCPRAEAPGEGAPPVPVLGRQIPPLGVCRLFSRRNLQASGGSSAQRSTADRWASRVDPTCRLSTLFLVARTRGGQGSVGRMACAVQPSVRPRGRPLLP